MSRRDRRVWNALIRKVKPYAAALTAWGAKQPKMPVDPIEAAMFYEKKTGKKPPIPYDQLRHFLKGPKDREKEAAARRAAEDKMLEAFVKANQTKNADGGEGSE